MISLEITKEDAELFVVFQENYDTFVLLKDSGLFGIRNGLATINFDSSGAITDIDCNFKLFKRGKPVLVGLHLL